MRFTLLTFLLPLAWPGFSQNIVFADTTFRDCLISMGVDTSMDGEISQAEAAAVRAIRFPYGCNFQYIYDLGGIEYFINLDTLDVLGHQLRSLDLSQNTRVKYLDCSSNPITSLNLSANLDLEVLLASGTSLDTLEFGTNSSMRYVDLNYLYPHDSVFDFSGLPNLEELYYQGATDVDMRENPKLRRLSCWGTRGVVNVSNNPNLEFLYCMAQSELDVTSCVNLEWLEVEGRNNSRKLDSIDLRSNPNLKRLDLWNNNLSEIDLSQNPKLEFVRIGYNPIPFIDFTYNPEITYLVCGNPRLRGIDVTGLTKLETLATGNFLSLNSSSLESLDVSTNVNLRRLYCPSGKLTSLNVSHNPLLWNVHCGGNMIDTLIFCDNPHLSYLHCAEMPSLTHVFIPDTDSVPDVYRFNSPNWQFYDCSLLVGTELPSEARLIEVYPNPARHALRITKLPPNQDCFFKITDPNGKLMFRGMLDSEEVNIGSLRSGIYFLNIFATDGQTWQHSFLKE